MIEDVVRAKLFELVDEDGNRRASLATDLNGTTSLRFFGADEAVRLQAGLTQGDDAAFVVLFDRQGHETVSLAGLADGGGGLHIKDLAGTLRAVVNVDPDGTVCIELCKSPQSSPVWIRLHPDGTYDGSFERADFSLTRGPDLHVVRKDDEKP